MWIVDPIDGTTNFSRGIPLFNISIALSVDREVRVGVVHSPYTDELYYVEKGKGAFVNSKHHNRIHVSDTVEITKAFLSMGRGTTKDAVEKLKKSGFWVHGFASESDLVYTALDYKGKVALVFGSEGMGIKPTVKKACDMMGSIPMPGRIESLNISVAVGIVLYEALRQRRTS